MKFKKPEFWSNKYSIISLLLMPLSFILILINFFLKNKKSTKFKVPVICVGNIYLGGTGKTPVAMEIYKILKKNGKKPAFVKKYYGFVEDEINLLKRIGKVYTKRKRADSILQLIKDKYSHAILDDGFQDSSIVKDLSIICFHSKQWIGNGRILPSGPLRESLKNIRNAECILINGSRNKERENLLKKYNSKIKIFYYKYLLSYEKKLKEKKFIAFAGIGCPENYFELLKENKFKIVKSFSFPDHYVYKSNDIDNLFNIAKKLKASLITTEKDYLRIKNANKNRIMKTSIKLNFINPNSFKNYIKSNI